MVASAMIFARMRTWKILRDCNLECDAVRPNHGITHLRDLSSTTAAWRFLLALHGTGWSTQGPNQRAGG